MKNYNYSDYAVNKYASGIVYRHSTETVEVTLEDYLQENPDKTEADFAELKALSDEIFEEEARDKNRQTYRDISIHGLHENTAFAVAAADVEIIDRPEQYAKEQQKRQSAKKALDKLTDTQRRRYLMYYVCGLSMRKIAEKEGVLHSKIQKSLAAAEKKIKGIISNAEKQGVQND